jgi:hypothetical protein
VGGEEGGDGGEAHRDVRGVKYAQPAMAPYLQFFCGTSSNPEISCMVFDVFQADRLIV